MAEAISGARTAVVTGANRGIGEAIAAELRARGLRVVPTSREPRQGFVTLDVTRADHVEALAGQLPGDGGVDVLVNNAGTSLDGFDERIVRRTLDANFRGALRVTDALLPIMRPGGRIVMVSSGLGSLTGVRVEDGARTPVWLALLPEGGPTGGFFRDEHAVAF